MLSFPKSRWGITAAIFAVGLLLCLTPALSAAESWRPAGNETSVTLQARTSPINRPKEVGTYYEATAPDTLDLAERARLGLNHFTESIREELDYEMVMGINGMNGVVMP